MTTREWVRWAAEEAEKANKEIEKLRREQDKESWVERLCRWLIREPRRSE